MLRPTTLDSSKKTNLHSPSKGFRYWLDWSLATGLGWVISNLLAGLIFPEFAYPFILRGILIGFTIGIFQWLVIRKVLRYSGFWILSNIISWTLAYLAGTWMAGTVFKLWSNPYIIEIVTAGARYTTTGIVVGISLGFSQWFLVKSQLAKPILWFKSSVLAWSIPFIVYAAFIYLSIAVPLNGRFTWPGIVDKIFEGVNYFIYFGIGFLAGTINDHALD